MIIKTNRVQKTWKNKPNLDLDGNISSHYQLEKKKKKKERKRERMRERTRKGERKKERKKERKRKRERERERKREKERVKACETCVVWTDASFCLWIEL